MKLRHRDWDWNWNLNRLPAKPKLSQVYKNLSYSHVFIFDQLRIADSCPQIKKENRDIKYHIDTDWHWLIENYNHNLILRDQRHPITNLALASAFIRLEVSEFLDFGAVSYCSNFQLQLQLQKDSRHITLMRIITQLINLSQHSAGFAHFQSFVPWIWNILI